MKNPVYIPLATLALLIFATTAQAQIIYSDNLTEYSSGTLNGKTVPTGSGAGTAWSANTAFTLNSLGASTSTFAANAILAFTPVAGNVYTLQATLVGTDGNIGFGTNVTTSDFAIFDSPSSEIRIYPGLADAYWINSSGTTNSGGEPTTARPSTDPLVLTITLNTTGTHWTTSFNVSDTDEPSDSWSSGPITFGTNPTTINDVYFGSEGHAGTWSNFSLSTPAVPEPSTTGLIFIGGIWLAVVVLRRQGLLRNP